MILSGLHFHGLYFFPLNPCTFLPFTTLFGSSLVSVLLTILAVVPRVVWCPSQVLVFKKRSCCVISSHPPPPTCVFIPIYLMCFLAWQVLLSSYRIYSLNLIIPFALFWIFSNSFILFTRKQDQNCTQYSKRRYGQVQNSLFFWCQLGQWAIIIHNIDMWFLTLVISLTTSLLGGAGKICLTSQISVTDRGKGAVRFLAQHGGFDDCHDIILTRWSLKWQSSLSTCVNWQKKMHSQICTNI